MSSSSLGRGVGAGTDGRDASEERQREFIPANVVTHEKFTEADELLASERFCEEIGGIVVAATAPHLQVLCAVYFGSRPGVIPAWATQPAAF